MQKCEISIKIYKVLVFPLIALTHRVIASRLCERTLTYTVCIKLTILNLPRPHLNEPRREKTCLCYMRTTKAQICLRIRAVGSAQLLFAAGIV